VHRPGAGVLSFDPTLWPECTWFWGLLPPSMRQVIEQRPIGSIEGMVAALAAGERYHAAFLDSVHTEEQVWAEFELARQLVVEGGLILVHDPCLPSGTVEGALARIEAEGYGVTRLMTASEGVPEDDGLGLAVIENRCRARGGFLGGPMSSQGQRPSMGPLPNRSRPWRPLKFPGRQPCPPHRFPDGGARYDSLVLRTGAPGRAPSRAFNAAGGQLVSTPSDNLPPSDQPRPLHAGP